MTGALALIAPLRELYGGHSMSELANLIEKAETASRDPSRLTALLEEFTLSAAKKRFVKLRGFNRAVVVGDLHGDLQSFRKALEIAAREGYPGGTALILLGDYVDRGPQQLETVALALSLSLSFGDSTVVLRGNHEPPALLLPYPHDFPMLLQRRFGAYGGVLYARFLSAFDCMSLAAYDEASGALFLHGGLPVRRYEDASVSTLEDYLGGESERWRPEYTEILWNDPSDEVDAYEPSPRGVGHLWGPRVTSYVAERFGVTAILRGHEPAPLGFRLNHGGIVATIFSRLGPPYYNEKACVAVVELSFKKARLKFECWP